MDHKISRLAGRLFCLLLCGVLLLCGSGVRPAQAAGTPTSLGLAQHGMNAYRDGWVYQYAGKGETVNDHRVSDCAGLIYAYYKDLGRESGLGGGASSMVKGSCVLSGQISGGIPRIHGLLLTCPDASSSAYPYSHVGIYVGNGEVVDNSEPGVNMRWMKVADNKKWTAWHVIDQGTQYPKNGWFALDGKMVHYTNFQYDVSATVDGLTIGSDGYAVNADGSYAAVDTARTAGGTYGSALDVAALLENGSSVYNGTVTGDGVRLRKEPTTASGYVATLPKGAAVKVLGEVHGQSVTAGGRVSDVWYELETTSKITGYMSALYVSVSNAAPPAPVITCFEGAVSITCQDSEAEIYYTVDGSAPSSASTKYTGPVAKLGCVYKAVAVKSGQQSAAASLAVLTSGNVFTDVENTWYFPHVDAAVAAGLFSGTGNNIFAPNREITRIEFVTVLANLAKADLSPYTAAPFADVTGPNQVMMASVAWAADKGYVSGYDGTHFGPNDPITREQMCVILAQYAGLTETGGALFADDSAISDWARSYVRACKDNGIISGVGENRFDPKGKFTRAAACVVFLALSA